MISNRGWWWQVEGMWVSRKDHRLCFEQRRVVVAGRGHVGITKRPSARVLKDGRGEMWLGVGCQLKRKHGLPLYAPAEHSRSFSRVVVVEAMSLYVTADPELTRRWYGYVTGTQSHTRTRTRAYPSRLPVRVCVQIGRAHV